MQIRWNAGYVTMLRSELILKAFGSCHSTASPIFITAFWNFVLVKFLCVFFSTFVVINKRDVSSCTTGLLTWTKLEIILFLFHCRLIRRQKLPVIYYFPSHIVWFSMSCKMIFSIVFQRKNERLIIIQIYQRTNVFRKCLALLFSLLKELIDPL